MTTDPQTMPERIYAYSRDGGYTGSWCYIDDGQDNDPSTRYIRSDLYQPAQGWQTIESAPRDGKIILGYDAEDGIYTCAFDGKDWIAQFDCRYTHLCWPTHWMPLPAAPKPDAEGVE